LKANDFDAIILPGGFGAAKNLSNFATNKEFLLDKDIERILNDFHNQKKVIGACCISPILLAKAF
jgi:enhancing lycopene biosynthesis protein 2